MKHFADVDDIEFLRPRNRTLSLLSQVSDVSFWTVRHVSHVGRQLPIWSCVASVGGHDPRSASRIIPVGGHMALYRASRRDAERAMADIVARGCTWYMETVSDSPPQDFDPHLPSFSSLRELRMKAELMGKAGTRRKT